MSVVVNEVRRGVYLDSVALMRIARTLEGLDGVESAGLMIATPANRQILAEAGLLVGEGRQAGSGDLVIAIKAVGNTAAEAARTEAERLLQNPMGRASLAPSGAVAPRTLRMAVAAAGDANLALISVPGDFAAAEARKALRRGLNVMIFSDNVSVAEEAQLKREAASRGLLVMGPDCGTAIIAGVPLAFANRVPRGDIGLIGASGTGLQEVSCLIARLGQGVSHAIGVGGRDLKDEIGGTSTLMALELLAADPATRHIVLISKPPAAAVMERVLARAEAIGKPVTVCFLGAPQLTLPAGVGQSATLKAAAEAACGGTLMIAALPPGFVIPSGRGKLVRGLFAGGSLCAEAQVVLLRAGLAVASNVPVPGADAFGPSTQGHVMIDLGDDVYTRGRPHPMIDPAVAEASLTEALADARIGVVLLDVVLGTGGHHDPAGYLAGVLRHRAAGGPVIIASVTGTDADPQVRSRQVAKLEAVGIWVASCNADAAEQAARLATR